MSTQKNESLSVKKPTANVQTDSATEAFRAVQDLVTSNINLLFGTFRAGLTAFSTLNRSLADEFSKHSEAVSTQVPNLLRKNSEFLDQVISQTSESMEKFRSQTTVTPRNYVLSDLDYSRLAKLVAEEMKKNQP